MSKNKTKTNINTTMNEIKAIPEKEIHENEVKANEKETDRKKIIEYHIPMILLIIVGIIYIPTQQNLLLIPFSILMLITLFGWDSNSRVCPNCKKWNSIVWIKNEKLTRKTYKKVKNIFKKEKIKELNEYIKKSSGKCQYCGHTCVKEKIMHKI